MNKDNIKFIKLTTLSDTDLYLTKNPEITFFKYVYRRYSNFAIETKVVNFNQNTDFSDFVDIQIPKTGDLMHKIYLEVKLPKCYFKKPKQEYPKETAENLKNVLGIFQNFFTINNNKIEDFKNSIKSESLLFTWLKSIKEDYENYDILINDSFNTFIIQTIDYINKLYNKKFTILEYYKNSNLNINILKIDDNVNLDNILNQLLIIQENNKDFYKLLNKTLLTLYLKNSEDLSYNYAWIENLGYSLIDYVDLFIGDIKVCRDYGQFMFFSDIMDLSEEQRKMKSELIGNIKELTEFNDKGKSEYSLFIPLNFWFCRNFSASLPLVSLTYEEVNLRFKFNQYQNLAYIEKPDYKDYITDNNNEEEEVEARYGSDLFDNSKININLVIDYIYLNQNERDYFLKNQHNFLITQIQKHEDIINKSNIDLKNNNLNIRIKDFQHPTKGLIWTFQPIDYYRNLNRYTKCQYCRYDINNVSPFKTCSLSINSNILIKEISDYFEYIQPYQHFKNSGVKGLYSYWFSLKARELQPSGNCNFTKIKELLFNLDFNPNIFKYYDNFIFNCYAINYNILRIENGFIKLAYN